MPDFTRGVPYDQDGMKLCVRCMQPQSGGTSFACSSCWADMTHVQRDQIKHSEDAVCLGHLPRWYLNGRDGNHPGGMVETKSYDPIRDVADVMARAQGKCDFGAQKELWNYIVGELSDRFIRQGSDGARFMHWCHGGSGSGG